MKRERDLVEAFAWCKKNGVELAIKYGENISLQQIITTGDINKIKPEDLGFVSINELTQDFKFKNVHKIPKIEDNNATSV